MESIWTKTCSIPKRETLQNDISTEIAVIGAGMAGILTAYRLQKSGKQVVVLEASRIGSGQTRNTTAKITSQHGLMYADLIHAIGKEKAYQYAMANELAIKEYRKIIQEEHICCDFEDTCAYVYSQNKDMLLKEADAAASLGLPVSLTDNVSLPLDNISALCFENQAQFHPLKFIKPLADQLTIYENTPVRTVKKHIITTPKATVTAKHIVFATHYPFVNFPGMYFARMHQERSYVLALKKLPLQTAHISAAICP